MKRVAVVGGGLGGLAAALRLAKSGAFEVELFESSDELGGKAGSMRLGEFRFDTGPTLFTMSFVLEELFRDIGLKLSDYLTLMDLPIHCHYHYPDGSNFTAYTDRGQFIDEIDRFSPGSGAGMKRYLDHCSRIWEVAAATFLFSPFLEWEALGKIGPHGGLSIVRSIDSLRTMHRANRSFFDDPRLVQFADRYATYNGSNPYKAPGTLNVIQHAEQLGVKLPRNGIYGITRALEAAARALGVKLRLSTTVDAIVTSKSREVKGLVVGDESIEFDAVVSNCDVRRTYQELLQDGSSLTAFKYKHLPVSSSALVFYWGVDVQTELNPHTILFSRNYRSEFEDIFKKKICPADPTVYIYVSSKLVKDDAPKGCENWYVMINAPSVAHQDWEGQRSQTRAQVLDRIRRQWGVNLAGHIVEEAVYDPRDIETRTGSHAGSLYGPSSNSAVAAFLRQPNRSSRYKGLYFSGGSAHPGGGIPLVLLSGKMAAEAVLRREL